MATLWSEYQWCSAPDYRCGGSYTYSRSGSSVTYNVYMYVKMYSTGGWYNNVIGGRVTIDDVSWGIANMKSATSGTISYGTVSDHTWSGSVSKTSGTTKCYCEIADRGGAYNGRFDGYEVHTGTYYLTVPPAASTIGTCTAGTTLSGPTINVTKYSSSFSDTMTLTYNGKTITRSGFTSSQLSFTEAERLLIFQAQGAGTTATWTISGTTYNGSTSLGTWSGSVKITTEALSTITAANNFNVGDSTSYTVNNPCGGTYSVYARVSSYTGTSTYSASSLTGSTSRTVTPDADTIYSSNTSSKTGTIYWRITSYINGTSIGTVDSRTCTYTFLQSRCGPSLSTFKYAISDAGTKAIMNSSGSYYAYNVSTDLNKFISGKTTLNLQLAGSIQKSASISSYYVEVPGQTNITAASTSGTVTVATKVLTASGTVTGHIKDSRGFEATLSFTFTINDYTQPSFASVVVQRNPMSVTNPDQDQYVKLTTTVNAPSYMISDDQIKLFYSYKVSTSDTWSSPISISFTKGTNTVTISAVQLGTAFDPDTQYDFRLQVQDYYLNSSSTYIISDVQVIPISAPLISRRGSMVGINKIPTQGALDVAGAIYATGTNAAVITSGYVKAGTNVAVGTYIEFDTAYNSSSAPNACTIKFKKSDGTFDLLRITNGEVFFNDYELLPFEVVDEW